MADSLVENVDHIANWRVPLAMAVAAGCYELIPAIGSHLLDDPDTYLNISLGNWIIAHRQVPHVDVFSATVAGRPWISSQWLAQVLFAQAYAVAGWAGVVVLSAVAIAIAQGLLTRFLLNKLATMPTLVLSTIGVWVMASPYFVARAHTLALPLMVAWVGGLVRAIDERRGPPFGLLPLMTLWANVHGGFTFGILFVAPIAVEGLWNAAPTERVRVALTWAVFGLLTVVAACITPYGPESILATRRILGLGQALTVIHEWQPQNFSALTNFELCLLLSVGFALYLGFRLPLIRILVLLGLLYMALTYNRNGEMFGFLAPIVVAAPLAPQLGRRENEPVAFLLLLIALGAASVAIVQRLDYHADPRITPTRALAAVKASGKTHILNSYNFGGYLIASGVPPFIDGRTELYGESFFMRHDRAVYLRDVGTLLQLLRDYHIDVTLLTPDAPAIGLLDRLKDWRRIYSDDIAVVHVRTDQARENELR